jgi:hypothetical protein
VDQEGGKTRAGGWCDSYAKRRRQMLPDLIRKQKMRCSRVRRECFILFLSLSLILFLSFLLLLLIARTWSSKGREKTGGREFVDRRGWLLTLTRPTFAPSPLLADAHTCLTFLVLFLRLFLYLFFAFCIFIALQCLAHAQLQRCTYLC